MFIILFVLVVSWVYAYVKTYHIVHFIFFTLYPLNMCSVLYVRFTLRKLLKIKFKNGCLTFLFINFQ